MAHDRRFRFGIQLSSAPDTAGWADLARAAEDRGFSTLVVPDHLGDQFAPIPAILAAASATSGLRVGSLVLDNDFRHPVVLAKEAATLDVLSGGRLELGLGAGWMNADYNRSGIAKAPAAVRIGRMEEAIAVLKGCFAGGPFDFQGEHYQVSGLEGRPAPLQRPHQPLLIGGGGRRVLEIAAREAQIVGINPSLRSGEVDAEAAKDGVAGATDEKLAWVKEAAGERYDDLELNVLVLAALVTEDREGTLGSMAPLFGLTPVEMASYPHVCVGSPEQIRDDLLARRERWDVSYWVFQGQGALDSLAPVVAELAGR